MSLSYRFLCNIKRNGHNQSIIAVQITGSHWRQNNLTKMTHRLSTHTSCQYTSREINIKGDHNGKRATTWPNAILLIVYQIHTQFRKHSPNSVQTNQWQAYLLSAGLITPPLQHEYAWSGYICIYPKINMTPIAWPATTSVSIKKSFL